MVAGDLWLEEFYASGFQTFKRKRLIALYVCGIANHIGSEEGGHAPFHGSLHNHEEWLSFLREIRGELSGVATTDVLYCVNFSVRDEQDLACFERHWRSAVELVFQQAFDDVDEFFTWMPVSGGRRSRGDPHEGLNDLGLAASVGLNTCHGKGEVTLTDGHNYHLFQPLFYQDYMTAASGMATIGTTADVVGGRSK